jgi:hypothetical protein
VAAQAIQRVASLAEVGERSSSDTMRLATGSSRAKSSSVAATPFSFMVRMTKRPIPVQQRSACIKQDGCCGPFSASIRKELIAKSVEGRIIIRLRGHNQRSRVPMIRSAVLTTAAVTGLGACKGPGEPGGDGLALRIVAGGNTSDTISARPTQGLVVRVLDEDGRAASLVEVRFDGGPGGMRVSPVSGQFFSNFASAVTDANGRATVRVAFGTRAGPDWIAVAVPVFGMTNTARYTIQPGNAVSVAPSPSDTIIPLGGTFAYREPLRDRANNAITATATYTASGNAVQVSSSGTVTGLAVGFATVTGTVTLNGATLTGQARVGVVPTATIAWTIR